MYSRKTEFLKLPQWEPLDKPSFTVDINKAFETLDGAVANINLVTDNLNASYKQLSNDVRAVEAIANDAHINDLISEQLGAIENAYY